MCSRHRPENGADSDQEPVDYRDMFCGLCNLTVWDGSLRAETMAGTVIWVCGACRRRNEARYAAMTS